MVLKCIPLLIPLKYKSAKLFILGLNRGFLKNVRKVFGSSSKYNIAQCTFIQLLPFELYAYEKN